MILVNFFYAQPVGHAVEALHYAHGHFAADPTRRLSVALNAATAVELADMCPFIEHAYAIEHPFLEPGPEHATLDQLSYLPHQPLRFTLEPAELEQRTIAVMLAGSSEPALYPSLQAWSTILDALHEAHPDVRPVLIGRTGRDQRTSSALDRRALLDHPSRPLDAYDLPLKRQLAIVKASELFLSPHTGFGLAALATGTPWLTISGGRWFEYYFNHVPFRSVIPDVERFPCFSQFSPAMIVDGRTPSMSDERIAADLDRIVAGATDLLERRVSYEQALTDYFAQLRAATSDVWSIDGVHLGR